MALIGHNCDPDLLVLPYYLFDFKDLLNQVVNDKEEEDDLEAHHHVIGPVDVAEQLHRVETEAWKKRSQWNFR